MPTVLLPDGLGVSRVAPELAPSQHFIRIVPIYDIGFVNLFMIIFLTSKIFNWKHSQIIKILIPFDV